MDFKKDNNLFNGKGENDIDWITINGTHIPIKNGESKKQSVEEFSKKYLAKNNKHDIIELPKQEYAELCSAIRTKHTNKIPRSGGILYKDDYYVYNYSKKSEKITCVRKIPIQGNENLIKRLEEYYE